MLNSKKILLSCTPHITVSPYMPNRPYKEQQVNHLISSMNSFGLFFFFQFAKEQQRGYSLLFFFFFFFVFRSSLLSRIVGSVLCERELRSAWERERSEGGDRLAHLLGGCSSWRLSVADTCREFSLLDTTPDTQFYTTQIFFFQSFEVIQLSDYILLSKLAKIKLKKFHSANEFARWHCLTI